MSKSKVLNLFIEYANAQTLANISKELSDQNVKVLSLEITKQSKTDGRLPCAIYSVQLVKKSMGQKLITDLSAIEGVSTVEEL